VVTIEQKCKNFSDPSAPPGCLGDIDEKYTMDFTDVEPDGYIYWCSFCGPKAHELNNLLNEALATRGPEFAKKLDAALTEKEKEAEKRQLS
jgi:hypothetical protein